MRLKSISLSKLHQLGVINSFKATDITRTKTEFILNGGQVKRKDDFNDGT